VSRIESLPIERWEGPFDAALRERAVTALEDGKVLFLPHLAFLLDPVDRAVLAGAAGDGRAKNISFDPATQALKGTTLDGHAAVSAARLFRRFSEQATALLLALIPGYAAGLRGARTSYRPAEIAERAPPSWRRDDRLLHVDAFPSRPSHGERILRVFCNVDPSGAPRRWRVGGAFEGYAQAFLPRVRPPIPGSAAVRAWAGLTKGRRSRYDHLMLGLHDAAKRDAAYQADPAHETIDFPAGSSWIVFTDQTPHAALAGRCAFEQTFHLDPAARAESSRAPLRILDRLTSRTLAGPLQRGGETTR
jgi:hypothetical protein